MYTGLKDKNGKEIYEGDIVRDEVAEEKYSLFEPAIFTVEWVEMGFLLRDKSGTIWDYSLRGMEVIGNIYENPELIAPASASST